MKTHFELRKAHTQNNDPILISIKGNSIKNYLNKRLADPFSYDVNKWIWNGTDWDVEYYTGDDFLKELN